MSLPATRTKGLALLVAVMVGLLAVATMMPALATHADGFSIVQTGYTTNVGANTTTYTYTLQGPAGGTVSHVTIALCLGEAASVSHTEPAGDEIKYVGYGVDNSVSPPLTGHKWETDSGDQDGEIQVGATFSLTYNGIYNNSDPAGTTWLVKKGASGGQSHFRTGTTTGPSCVTYTAKATVNKTVSGTDAPSPSGWTLQLKQGTNVVSTLTSDSQTGTSQTFQCNGSDCLLTPGASYTIVEPDANAGGVTTTNSGDCGFTVPNPLTQNLTYSCTYDNHKDQTQTFSAKATVNKTVSGTDAPSPSGWTLQLKQGTNVVSTLTSDSQTGTSQTFQCNGSDCLLTPGASYTIVEPDANTNGVTTSSSGQCSFSVPDPLTANTTYSCTFNNHKSTTQPPPKATIIVEKQTLPDGATGSFSFSGALNASLSDGQSASTQVDAGTYNVSETVPAGWVLSSIVCSDSDSTGSGQTATFNVTAGETVKCTFTNTQNGAIVVEKQTDPDGAADTFDFTGDVTATLGDGDTASADVAPGAYTVVEGETEGWTLEGVVCDDDDSSGSADAATASYVVGPGETVTCTFTNSEDDVVLPKPPITNTPQPGTPEEPEPTVLPKRVLPLTGGDPSGLVAAAGLLMAAGGAALALGRGRKRDEDL